ncbi:MULTISPECIES: hypothetical protein [Rhodococcus]|jgi:hypothetical protein|uniref:hypothetical protein n=1 Tax=Rhodococcus TaxID=1827 RepID=UPI00131F4FF3|nr:MULTISPECIES: hypothetical protein [Rhodococcus]MDV7242598.1 hypothetical protein [Rhodococcus oxybenzonivorans]MDV7276030.1 hypothetical protein [Rhodococcus oxybenzonivorans]MDV7332087.1 hypothetical protein [Rhodococcus oxybenzonivorans]MDV7344307.1 hypothetical protein [Rhodococcus oxybenzonivorans]MDV7351914.1 hypothetical protein [Rhodococcus oxybenzonivorans]
MPVPQHKLLQSVQDRTIELRRWLDADHNSAALTAYLRDEPVDDRWLATYLRLQHDLLRAVGHAHEPEASRKRADQHRHRRSGAATSSPRRGR